jgi:hypothetical protein
LENQGVTQPLIVLAAVLVDIMMDFVEGFPRVNDKSVVLTVVDRFSKYAHFILIGHPYMVMLVTWAFFNNIIRLHHVPNSIVRDRDLIFMSRF